MKPEPTGHDSERRKTEPDQHEVHDHKHHERTTRGAALHAERIHPEHLAASLENVEELFAPTSKPDDIEYGAQPPG